MAQFACQLSDQVILTSDNPRSEDPKKIINEMKAGLNASQMRKVLSLEDRREAIIQGTKMINNNDCLVVLGKGHENFQETNSNFIKFSDHEVINEIYS